ncbi:unnamed protein product [Acanthoscelides obtectus]|uniref:HAT C-terminal dimerisation domain-containing protein n=1 Tax=Acanthoscelides obtectus TaxID=200917 RepID=A0A9P0KEV1_ACAOB|nr:unnamed protein product [Acanthoscelides obtectus]CAK1676523.1 hypothetical protein AOBTE_LOCUS30797 [Acanthoscelides obtectus]
MSADNTNTNFGGMRRKGVNNLFSKLNASRGKPVIGIGCVAHIFNNCLQNATDVLPIDVEVIAVKIFKHFYISTVRVEKLKQFCDFVDVEYKKMLSFSKTRFLSLMPAIERIVQMFEPLKAYFLSIDNCPTVLKQFFQNPINEAWMWFVHNIASLFHKVILDVEGDKICATEAALEYFELINKLQNRLNELYLPLKDYIGPILNQDELFDEVSLIRTNVTEDKIVDWNSRNISTEDRWLEVFQKESALKNLKILCEFVFCLPGTSASLERLFSNINNYWSPDKSQLKISTLEAIMQVYTNFKVSCNEMFQFLKSKPQLLKEIHGSKKYDWYQNDDQNFLAGTSKEN